MCFLEESYENMQKIQILKMLRAPSIRHQGVCLYCNLVIIVCACWSISLHTYIYIYIPPVGLGLHASLLVYIKCTHMSLPT